MSKKQPIEKLIFKSLLNQLTQAEKNDLDEWIAASPGNKARFDRLTDHEYLAGKFDIYCSHGTDPEKEWKKAFKMHLSPPVYRKHHRIKKIYFYYSGLAAIIISVAFAVYWWIPRHQRLDLSMNDQHSVFENDIPAPQNHAVLVLADGLSISLDSNSAGSIMIQGQTKVRNQAGNILEYETPVHRPRENELYNTVITPCGGYYEVKLEDGSKIWLNASSTIHFPVVFNDSVRRVDLVGEAYFEIAPLAKATNGRMTRKIPFVVSIKSSNASKGEIRVIGTHFNVSAYPDEEVKTTLLEGKIQLNTASSSKILSTGQKATLKDNNITLEDDPNAEETIAWKQGLFKFREVPLHEMLMEVGRWYGADIKYRDTVNGNISSTIPRNLPLSRVLKVIEASGIAHCSIIGKTIIVSK